VAVDWQEPVVLQRKLRPSIARVNGQLDPRYAASKHTTAPINHTRPNSPGKHSPDGAKSARKQISDYSLLIYRPWTDERLGWPSWLTCSRWFTHGHPSAAGRAQDKEVRRSKTAVLPLCHAIIFNVYSLMQVLFLHRTFLISQRVVRCKNCKNCPRSRIEVRPTALLR